MIGWHHQLNGHEFEQALGDEGQGSLECRSPWGRKELDVTERLNNKRSKADPAVPGKLLGQQMTRGNAREAPAVGQHL